VLVELKALDRITGKEEAQVIHYLLSSQLQRALLLNFGASSLQVRRFLGSNATTPLGSVKSVSSVDAVS